MQDSTIIFIIGILLMTGWFGTTAYSTYAKHKAEIARIESNAEDFRRSIQALSDANVANAEALKAGLDRAIELLADRGRR